MSVHSARIPAAVVVQVHEHVPAEDIIDVLEMQFAESSCFWDLDPDRVETLPDLLRDEGKSVGQEPGLPALQKEEWPIPKRIILTDALQQLPTRFEFTSSRP